MPIFDQGYQHWDGKLSGHAWRWLAVARRGVKTQLKNRSTRGALLLAWGPALVLGGFLTLWGLLEQKTEDWVGFFSFLPDSVKASPKAFRAEVWTMAFSFFLTAETYVAMVLVVIIGPNLISQDLRFNAMPLYLSRPLTRFDYFAGKLGTIAAFLAAVMIIPAVLAYLIGVAFSLNVKVFTDTYKIVPACIAYGAILVLAAGLFMLAISSLSKNSRYIGAAWIGIWLIGDSAASKLSGPGTPDLKWGPLVSLTSNFGRLRECLLGVSAAYDKTQEVARVEAAKFMPLGMKPPPFPNPFAWDYPWKWSAYVLLGIVGLSLWILTTRVKSLDRLR
jgi:ABC-2 type transport system permease protein